VLVDPQIGERAARYGLIWAALGALGFLVAPVGRRMVQRAR